MYNPVKLTKRTAWELISRICPNRNIKKEETPPDVCRYTAYTGGTMDNPSGFEIRCENDWYKRNGRIKLTIYDLEGGLVIVQYFHPDTLNRDLLEEQAEKEAAFKEARQQWVQQIGKEAAHRLVDQYWEG